MKFSRPCLNAPNIEFIRRDVKIAAEENVGVGRTVFVKISPEPLEPIEFEREFIRPELGAVRNIGVDDMYAFYRRGDQAFRRFAVVVGKIFLYVLDREFRKYRDAVVRFLTEERRFVNRVV